MTKITTDHSGIGKNAWILESTDFSESDKARFWNKVKIGAKHECWNWTAYKDSEGYGQLYWRGTGLVSSRIAFALSGRSLCHGNSIVRHICDNSACCNPSHLESGSMKDNAEDRVKRGRQAKGERVGTSKLTEDAVREIKRLWGLNTSKRKIANQFGVSDGCIQHIGEGRTWKHVR